MVLLPLIKKKKKKQIEPTVTVKTEAPKEPTPTTPEQKTNTSSGGSSGGTGKRQINFRNDGNVEVTTEGGTKRILTRDEYKKYNEQISGGSKKGGEASFTPQVKELVDIQRENQAIRNEQIAAKAGNQTKVNVAQVTPEQLAQQEQLIQTIKDNTQKEQMHLDTKGLIQDPNQITTIGKINAFGESLGAGSLKNYNPISKKNIANFSDWVRVAVTGKKPLRLTQAEGALTDAISTVDLSVELVKSGYLSYDDALNDLIAAENALNRLERTQKGIGQENLRYWSDEGAEVEALIANKKRRMLELKFDLLNAKNSRAATVEAQNRSFR